MRQICLNFSTFACREMDWRIESFFMKDELLVLPSEKDESTAQQSEELLLELSKEEKDRIFDTEFSPHLSSLYNFAYYLSRNDEVAQDLVQETLLRAYNAIYSFRLGTNGRAWLFKILKNLFLNQARELKTKPRTEELDEITFHHESENSKKYDYLHEQVSDDTLSDEVAAAIASLPLDFKTVLLLYDIEGFSYEEIKEITNVPLGTVRSRLHRSRSLLKNKLSSFAEKEGYKIK